MEVVSVRAIDQPVMFCRPVPAFANAIWISEMGIRWLGLAINATTLKPHITSVPNVLCDAYGDP
jgi:hypothetical protein